MTKKEVIKIIASCPYRSKDLIDVIIENDLSGIHLATCNLDYEKCPSSKSRCFRREMKGETRRK